MSKAGADEKWVKDETFSGGIPQMSVRLWIGGKSSLSFNFTCAFGLWCCITLCLASVLYWCDQQIRRLLYRRHVGCILSDKFYVSYHTQQILKGENGFVYIPSCLISSFCHCKQQQNKCKCTWSVVKTIQFWAVYNG